MNETSFSRYSVQGFVTFVHRTLTEFHFFMGEENASRCELVTRIRFVILNIILDIVGKFIKYL